MHIWLLSDWHLSHRNILSYCDRPFKDVNHMNEELIARHNARVNLEDLVINVGDFSLDERVVESTLKRLNGTHILICGNHDKPHRSHSRAEYWRKKYLEWGFAEVLQTYELQIAGESVLIEHMPYREDIKRHEKYKEYRPVDTGRWLVHGHSHYPPAKRIRERQIDVGVDANGYAPVSIDEVAEIIYETRLAGEALRG